MKNFFKAKDEWDSAHSHIWVYGATAEQMINPAKEYEDYENISLMVQKMMDWFILIWIQVTIVECVMN